jgi:ubiquinone biosynthesis protein COQ4
MQKMLSKNLIRNFLSVVNDPTRTDLIFKVITAPEILTQQALDAFLAKIRRDPSSLKLLNERYARPWKVSELAEYPKESLGYVYARHMLDNNLDADFFDKIPGDTEDAYIQMRMRQTHDIWHVVTGFDTSVAGEIGLQAFQMSLYGSRSSGMIISMFLLHGVMHDGDEMCATTAAIARGWSMGKACTKPLFGERFEEMWDRDLREYRQALGLSAFQTDYGPEKTTATGEYPPAVAPNVPPPA